MVIPALNEENLIQKTLDSLGKQRVKGFSVIVVDNGSVDMTKEIVLDYVTRSSFNLLLLEEDKKGVGYARDSGSKKAAELGALYIAGTDADTILPPDWVGSIYKGFETGDCDLLCGECDPLKNVKFGNDRVSFTLNARSVLFKKVKPYFRGANFAITAEMFKEVGGFKQPLTKEAKPAPGEDGALEVDALRLGAKICPCLATVYPHPRRYISNLIKIADFNGSVHEGGVVTEVRNETDLERVIGQIPESSIDIFIDKVSVSFFNEFVVCVFNDPVLKSVYWENSLRFLEPFGREEVERDLSSGADIDLLWKKYKNVLFENIRRSGNT